MKAITTKYHGPTNTRGSRISATDEDGNRAVVSYNYSLSGELVHREAVYALCRKMGWTGELVSGCVKGGYVYVWTSTGDTFRVDAPGGYIEAVSE